VVHDTHAVKGPAHNLRSPITAILRRHGAFSLGWSQSLMAEHHHQAAQQTHNRWAGCTQGAAVPSALIQAITVYFLHLAYSSRAS
jgi:hypothetical protein